MAKKDLTEETKTEEEKPEQPEQEKKLPGLKKKGTCTIEEQKVVICDLQLSNREYK